MGSWNAIISAMEESVFTRIIKGEIPSYKVYEDDKTFAFLDIHPVVPGMTLVITKNQVASFEDLEESDYHALWETVKKVAQKMREVFPDSLKIAVQVEGLEVAHVHVKVFPLHTVEDFRKQPSEEVDSKQLELLVEKMRF